MSISSDLIVIESKNRSSGSPNDFKITLSENLTNGNYLLTSFSMSNNLYNVVAGENDKLYVEHSVDGNNTLTLTPGKYSSSTLLTELKTQLDSISAVVYTITYSATTGKYTFTPDSGNFGFKFSTNTTASCRFLIGKNAVDDVLGASQVSDNPIDLKLHDIIAIKILQDNNSHGTLSGGTEFSVLIPLDSSVAFGDTIHYKTNVNFQQSFAFSSAVNTLDIELYAGDGDLLPINGTEWCMSMKKQF